MPSRSPVNRHVPKTLGEMSNLPHDAAALRGRRISNILEAVVTANFCFFLDWILPSWFKMACVVFNDLFNAYHDFVSPNTPWPMRFLKLGPWMVMCTVSLTLIPHHQFFVVNFGLYNYGVNIFFRTWLAMQIDGPMNIANADRSYAVESIVAYSTTYFCLTHRPAILALANWACILVGVPGMFLFAMLYCLRAEALLASILYALRISLLFVSNQTLDAYEFSEAQLFERLPRYLQRRWSSYQQGLPGRARLPTYQYQPLGTWNEIRLLVLMRSPLYPSVIRAKIIHQQTIRPPRYEAVSYCWGSSDLTEEILVDGCRFPVTRSAFDLLLSRRSIWRERTIWIDALCINQKDLREKSEQVQVIYRTYFLASRVIVYPGSGWRLRLAGFFIHELGMLCSHYKNTDDMDLPWAPEETRKLRWRAMVDLFNNEYFSRAWAVQEIASGQETQLYLGGVYVPWEDFAKVTKWCLRKGPSRKYMLTGSKDNERRIWRPGRTFDNIAFLAILRPDIIRTWHSAETWNSAEDGLTEGFKRRFDLENLLYITSGLQTTDPRDKVFGLIGLTNTFSMGDAAALITPDYTLSVERVFWNAARAVFALPPARPTIHILSLAGTGFAEDERHRRRCAAMPSWVPDFSTERLHFPYTNVLESRDSFFSAGGDPLGEVVTLDDKADNCLVVRAVVIDHVAEMSAFGTLDWRLRSLEVVDTLMNAQILHIFVTAAITLCLKHARHKLPAMADDGYDYDSDDEYLHGRLWSVLIGGRIQRMPADAKFQGIFPHWLRWVDVMARARDPNHYEQLARNGGATADADTHMPNDGTYEEYRLGVVEANSGRRVAITAAGRMCIVPPLTRTGDSIIIPLGSQTPFVVRKRHRGGESSSEGGDTAWTTYELVGEAWVEGVMYGEMMGNSGTDHELIRLS